MPVVVLVGTLDTKGPELRYLPDRLRELGGRRSCLSIAASAAPPRTPI